MDTMITSWDSTKNDVDTDLGDGRAYISAISEVPVDEDETCKGVAKNDMGESRMDIEGSEIAYMGYKASESWGISWKIRGLCLLWPLLLRTHKWGFHRKQGPR